MSGDRDGISDGEQLERVGLIVIGEHKNEDDELQDNEIVVPVVRID